jgi:uncharacterized membrane protein YgcG
MKKYLFWVLTVISLWLSSTAFADLWWFTIEWFHVDMIVHSDWSMDVKETIDTNFTEQRRGIYREVPIKDAAGDYIHIKNLQSIGNPVAAETIDESNYTLKIWDPDTYIFWPKQYIITYTVENAIKAYASGSTTTSGWWQEIYWNVVWPQWNTTIAKSSFTITLPKEYAVQTGNMFIVRWGNGEKNKGWVIRQINPTTIEWSLDTVLQPKQWVTIGVQFPVDYFVAESNYNELFGEKPSLGFQQSIKSWWNAILTWMVRMGEWIIPYLFWFIFIIIWVLWNKKKWSLTWRKSARKTSKAVAPYYLPPRNIEPAKAFWFWYNAQNPQIFVSLLYYRATKWWTRIELLEWKKYMFGIKWEDTFVIHEVKENPSDATETDKALLQKFFWPRDSVQDKVKLTKDSYGKMTRVLWELEDYGDQEWVLYEKKWNIFTRKYVLTSEWEKLFDEMRGYKDFLEKVERPALDAELKKDPNFLNTILPWAVLFGVETRLLKMCEDILKQMEWYGSYNWSALNAYTFASMTSSIKSSVIAPRDSWWGGSWSSGFWGGGGFSWGGGWGWGGGSR